MAVFYVIGCIIILCINYDFIIPAIATIFRLAFTPGAAAGGLVGGGIKLAIQYGVARGLFSNESGMGSAPIAAAAAQTRNPVRQALVSSTGTFWDTVVVCLMTGLVLVTTIMKNPTINANEIDNGGVLTSMAFAQIPYLGPVILVIGILCLLYHPGMGVLRRAERGIFCGEEGTDSLPCSVYPGCGGRSCTGTGSGMDGCGYPERIDGNSEPGCGSSALTDHCQ